MQLKNSDLEAKAQGEDIKRATSCCLTRNETQLNYNLFSGTQQLILTTPIQYMGLSVAYHKLSTRSTCIIEHVKLIKCLSLYLDVQGCYLALYIDNNDN